jgi:hypothetical protein
MFRCKLKNKLSDTHSEEINILINELTELNKEYHKKVKNITEKLKKLNISEKNIRIYESVSIRNKTPIKLYEKIHDLNNIYETIEESIKDPQHIRQRGLSAPPLLIQHVNSDKMNKLINITSI